MTYLPPARHTELSKEGLAALGMRNACDREPIHLSGAIQPHGALLILDAASFIVTAASENVAVLCGLPDPLGRSLGDLLGAEVAAQVRALPVTGNPYDALPLRIALPGPGPTAMVHYLVAHRSGPLLIVELEPAGPAPHTPGASVEFFQRQRAAMKALLGVDEVDEVCRVTVEEVRRLTGYDRVMVYRFEPDAHGYVIAEACNEDAEPFLGLHYPAGDIPRQARALYLRNSIRVIVDVDYEPAAILGLPDGGPADRLDLSMSVLRSVSPVHLQYLANMGVAATMTISLIVDNQLWGMISCHHDSPKHVDHAERLACEVLGQMVSVRLFAAESTGGHRHVRELGRLAAQVVTSMAAGETPVAGAVAAERPLLGMAAADGAVVEIDGERVCVGVVPGPEVLELLIAHLGAQAGSGPAPFGVSTLPEEVRVAAGPDANVSAAAGALFLPLPGRVEGFVLWLRGEYAHTVRWAGRPDPKPDEDHAPTAALTPRASFQAWREQVRDQSIPWRAAEMAVVTELAQAMPEVLLHRAQNRLVRFALHDPLTGLPNRVLLHQRLDALLGPDETLTTVSPGIPPAVAVLFVDLDGFKAVNDTRGHDAGDQLLALVAERLSRAVRPNDTVARVGGDEFVVLLPATNVVDAASIAQRIVEDVRRSFILCGRVSRSVTASVGVAVLRVGSEPGEGLRQADAALYHAKRTGRDQVAVYDPDLGTAATRQQLAGEELSDAITSGQIILHYQPVCRLDPQGRSLLHGFEALARWQHPTRGLLSPDLFIGLAEETGLIDALGETVMLQALRQLQAWPGQHLTMAVNVSVWQLVRPGFAAEVLSHLVELGIDPRRLCLEVTESQVMEKPELALAALHELDAAKVKIGIDDFGTGFSSLAYVRDLPAAVLKIDRVFVRGLPDSAKDGAVVAASIQLAHALGMQTVAEGVETVEQLEYLAMLGSDFVQGYLLGRPQPAADNFTDLDLFELGSAESA